MTAPSFIAHDLPRSATRPPLQITLRFRLDVAASEAFDLVAHRLPEWFGDIHAVTWDHRRSLAGADQPGVCSERSCDFRGKLLREEVVAYENGRRYAYRAKLAVSELKLPIAEHLGEFEVAPDGRGSIVTWRQHFRTRWFMPTAIMRWQMRDKMMRPAVDVLIQRVGGAWLPAERT